MCLIFLRAQTNGWLAEDRGRVCPTQVRSVRTVHTTNKQENNKQTHKNEPSPHMNVKAIKSTHK